jgi:UTP--glucose-1-phosphate uridylyltransferase
MKEATGGGSKELLPVGGQPVIARALSEAKAAGADDIFVISAEEKHDLNDYLSCQGVKVLIQTTPIGLGPAVAQALADDDCLILLPDSFFFPQSPSPRLLAELKGNAELAIAFRNVPDELVSRYGIAQMDEEGKLTGLIEKPKLENAPSRWAVNGRYAFSAELSLWLKNWITEHEPKPGEPELPLTPAIQAALFAGFKGAVVKVKEDEVRFDCGSLEGYRHAQEVFR